jgi:hypothetical protein
VIDLFSGDDLAQILHVKHDGESAMVTRAATSAQSGAILDDLDVRASDLLQTNAVVWVEGPSDRIYFKKWIELWSEGQLTEGIHYQCLPYGGSCNAYLTFEMDESAAEHLIAAFKINRRAIFLADSDRKKEGDKLNVHTKRLLEEVGGKGFGWVTRGRTIENYIPPTTLRQFLEKDDLDPPHQYADMLQFIADQKGNETKPVKTDLAHQITNRLTREDIAADVDLADTLDKVCALICKWNRIEVKPTRLG